MALTDENNMVMPVAPMYGNGNAGGLWGNDGSFWLLILFLFAFMGNGFGNGFSGGAAGTTFVANDVQRGFDQAAVTGGTTTA